jgi:hypothetical protein
MTGLPRLSVEPLVEPHADERLVRESPPRRLMLEPIVMSTSGKSCRHVTTHADERLDLSGCGRLSMTIGPR